MRGLTLGAVAGGFAGGILAAALIDPCSANSGFCAGPDSRAEGFGIGAAFGVLAVGAVGALIGALIDTSSWEPVVFPSASPGLAPLRVQLGVSFR